MQESCSSADLRCLFWAPLKDDDISCLQCCLEVCQCEVWNLVFNAISSLTQSCTAHPKRVTKLSPSPNAAETTEMLTSGPSWPLQASKETFLQPELQYRGKQLGNTQS